MSLADRVKETSTTTGTGDLTLAGAATGYESFSTAFATNEMFTYVAEAGAEWEIGYGHLSGATTLVRDSVIQSSNSDALVSFSAGTKTVFCEQPARTRPTRGQAAAMAGGLGTQ